MTLSRLASSRPAASPLPHTDNECGPHVIVAPRWSSEFWVVFSIFVVAVIVFLVNAGGHVYSSDEETMFSNTEAIATRHQLAIPNEWAATRRVLVSPGLEGRLYSVYGIAPSVLAVPLFLSGKVAARFYPLSYGPYLTRLFVSFFNIFVTAATCALLYVFARRLFERRWVAYCLAAVYGFASIAFQYAKTFYSEPLCTFFLLLTVYLLYRTQFSARRWAWLSAAGVATGIAFLTKTPTAIFFPVIGVYMLLPVWQDLRTAVRTVVAFASGFAVPAVLYFAMMRAQFGSIFFTPYTGHPETLNFGTPLYFGIYGLLLSSGKGLLFYFPLLLLLIPSLRLLSTRHRAEAFVFCGIFLTDLLFYAKYDYWFGGNCWGPRYMFFAGPFLVLPLGAYLSRNARKTSRIVQFALLAVVGFAVQLGGSLIFFNWFLGGAPVSRWPQPYQVQSDVNLNPEFSPILAHWLLIGDRWGEYSALCRGLNQPKVVLPGSSHLEIEEVAGKSEAWFRPAGEISDVIIFAGRHASIPHEFQVGFDRGGMVPSAVTFTVNGKVVPAVSHSRDGRFELYSLPWLGDANPDPVTELAIRFQINPVPTPANLGIIIQLNGKTLPWGRPWNLPTAPKNTGVLYEWFMLPTFDFWWLYSAIARLSWRFVAVVSLFIVGLGAIMGTGVAAIALWDEKDAQHPRALTVRSAGRMAFQRRDKRFPFLVELALVGFVAVVLTLWLTYPLAFRAGDHAIEAGDSLLTAYIQAWVTHALGTDLRHLFDTNMFYPARNTLALSENLMGNQILFAPVYLVTGNPLLASNIVILASFVFCGISMYLLVRYVTRSAWGAAVAGFIYAFAPVRTSQMAHMQLLSFYWPPLTVLFLLDYVRRRRSVSLVGFGATLLAQILSSLYLGYLVLIIAVIFFIAIVAVCRGTVNRLVLARLIAAALAVGAIVYTATTPYRRLQTEGVLRAEDVAQTTIAASASPVASYLNRGYSPHYLYGHLFQRFHSLELDWEKNLFPGFLAMFLALVGLASRFTEHKREFDPSSSAPSGLVIGERRKQSDLRERPMLSVAVLGATVTVVLGYVLSLGPRFKLHDQPTHLRLPLYWLQKWVPGMSMFRVPARFGLIVMFGLAILAGIGVAYIIRAGEQRRILQHSWRKAALTVAAILFLMAEYNFVPLHLYAAMVPPNVAPEYLWLSKQPPHSVTLELPIPGDPPDPYPLAASVYASVYHWQPLVNGYSGYAPQTWGEMYDLARDLPSWDAVQGLGSLGVRYVILHTEKLDTDTASQWRDLPAAVGLIRVCAFGDTVIYELPQPHCRSDFSSLRYGLEVPEIARTGLLFPLVISATAGDECWASLAGVGKVAVTAEWKEEGSSRTERATTTMRWPLHLREHEAQDVEAWVRAPRKAGRYSLRLLSVGDTTPLVSPIHVKLLERSRGKLVVTAGQLSGRYGQPSLPGSFRVRKRERIEFPVENTGQVRWPAAAPRGTVELLYTWSDFTGRAVTKGRIPLAYDVYPGTTYEFKDRIEVPSGPGNYVLSFEMISDSVAQFRDLGIKPIRVRVSVDQNGTGRQVAAKR